MYILGISCYYHNSATCLLKDGILICAAEEERFTGIKHDSSFPYNAIKFCLDFEGIEGKDLNYVVFYEKPFLKFERIIKTVLCTWPKSYNLFKEVVISWMKEKLWIKSTIKEFLGVSGDKILFCEHHLSHAASSFFCSPFDKAAILTCDGVGEWVTATLGVGRANFERDGKNEIKILKEITFPHSLGLLYSVFTAFLGFKVNQGEYKVMGLSAFGKPRYVDRIYEIIKVGSDGSFRLNMKYFSFHYSTKNSFNKNFIKLFGPPRKSDFELNFDKKDKEAQRFADIAASIQKVLEDTLIKIANFLYQETRLDKLCIGGGVGLNCVANFKILKNTPFKEIYIQPAAGDSGAALGAAFYVWHCLLNKKRRFILNHAYWGKDYSFSYIKNFLDKRGVSYKILKDEEELIKFTTQKLLEKKIIGWFQGKFEWGPRALGNRSILADPKIPFMKDKINLKIKFRENFRPFAASVLYEFTDLVFDIGEVKTQYPFKFMLYTVPVKKNLIPAAVHINKTCRPQILEKETNFLYYKLIENFYRETGVPALLNTSFNLKGKPIVNSPLEAYEVFKNSGLDVLIMDKFVIEKS